MKIKLSKVIICILLILIVGILAKNSFEYFNLESSVSDAKDKEQLIEQEIIEGEKNYATLLRYNLVKRSYSPDQLDEYIAQEGFDFEKENEKIVQDSLAKLYDKNIVNVDAKLKVPTITHRMYFSSPNNPKKISILYFEMLKESFNKLNDVGEEWEHNLWTNIPEVFPDEVKAIKGVKIRHIDEFKGHVLYETLVSIIKKGDKLVGHFSEASDLLRFMALQKFGGIYTDMDYEIYHPKPLLDLMRKFDFIGVKGINRYYETGFMAAKPNHSILNKALELEARNNGLEKNAKIPLAIKYPVDEYRRIYFSGPPLITVAYLAKNNIDGNVDMLLPYWVAFNYNAAQYKNKSCEDSSTVTKEYFEERNKNLDKILTEFTKNYKADDHPAYRNILKSYQQNIYYDVLNHRNDFEIIGADMSCGSWSTEIKGFKRIYYWNWPWSFNQVDKADEN